MEVKAGGIAGVASPSLHDVDAAALALKWPEVRLISLAI